MKMFSKEHGASKFFLPHSYFEIQFGMRGGAVFLESEPVTLSAPHVCAKHRSANGEGIFKHMRQRMIAHEFVCQHVSGLLETLVV